MNIYKLLKLKNGVVSIFLKLIIELMIIYKYIHI